MFKNIFQNIKSGMSLIELLVVITIIGILIGVLVPTIGNTQGRTRDITRQTQVQELAAALMSYKLDYGEFPPIKDTRLTGDYPILYRQDIRLLNDTLVAGGYLKKIPQDPANIGLTYNSIVIEKLSYDSSGYYIYISDGKSFMIITPVEDSKNGNSHSEQDTIILNLYNIGTGADKYEDFFNEESLDGTGNLYIYKYKDEVF